MTKHNNTVAAAHARIDTLEAKVDQILAAVTGKASTKPATKASATKASKAKGTKATSKATGKAAAETGKTEPKVRTITRQNRVEFIAANPWAKGKTTNEIRMALLDGSESAPGWQVGERSAEYLTGKAPATDRVIEVVAVKAGKKAKKGKKAKTQAVVAEVEASQPAKALTPAQVARINAPRNQHGAMTPKREWALRTALKEDGYSPAEVDTYIAKVYETPELSALLTA